MPRAATLQGPDLNDFLKQQQRGGSSSSVPGHCSASGDGPPASALHTAVSPRASSEVVLSGRFKLPAVPDPKVVDSGNFFDYDHAVKDEKPDALANDKVHDSASSCRPPLGGSDLLSRGHAPVLSPGEAYTGATSSATLEKTPVTLGSKAEADLVGFSSSPESFLPFDALGFRF